VKFGASFALSSALFPASTNYLKAVKDHGKIQENRNPANARILGSSILPSAPRQKHGKRQKLETRSTRQEYRISSNRLIRPSSAVAKSPESSEAKQSRLRRKHNKSLYRSRKARSGLLSLATRVPEVDFNMKPRSNWNAPSRSFLSNSS
jgi:hemin uptake protein HemP